MEMMEEWKDGRIEKHPIFQPSIPPYEMKTAFIKRA